MSAEKLSLLSETQEQCAPRGHSLVQDKEETRVGKTSFFKAVSLSNTHTHTVGGRLYVQTQICLQGMYVMIQ